MAGGLSTAELLKKLDDQHQAYLETFKLVHEALANNAAPIATPALPSSPPATIAPSKRRRRSTMEVDGERPDRKPSTYHSSVLTGESSESDDDDELYVQTPLPSYKFDHEHLKHHLKSHPFDAYGQLLLKTVIGNGRVDPSLFPEYPPEEKYHNSHYSVFDVGADGAPLSRREIVTAGSSIDSAIWQAIQDLNSDPAAKRPAVGRITIIREPSPIVFGALHLAMIENFDMDELFKHIVSEDELTSAHMTNRAYSLDHRQQRTFLFKFDYFTVVGEDLEPMPWQRTDKKKSDKPEHITISRCTSVVALSLTGGHIKKLRNAARRAKTQYGYIYDPWAPWHVLNIQCYPDHKHSMDSHDSTKHYVNGPEAFLHTLLAEFKDAQKRFEEILNKIGRLVSPSADFMFNGKLRDKLLFEDEEFTYSRRYFWAYQTLGIMMHGIKAMIDAYEDTFTEEVWEGKHKSLWPMVDEESSRNKYWRKRMGHLKDSFEKEIKNLEKLEDEIDERRKEIRLLRDQLFSGTSVLESRKSVELSAVTILQGHNIKLLTLVSIFFLPLTFVTSVFGMTNMPTDHQFRSFGIVMAVVCVPFFLLIGSLNTSSGMEFWRNKWQQVVAWITRNPLPVAPTDEEDDDEDNNFNKLPQGAGHVRKKSRSQSVSEAMGIRMAHSRPSKISSTSTLHDDRGNEATTSSRTQPQEIGTIERVIVNDPNSSDSSQRKVATEAITSVSSEKVATPRPEIVHSASWWEKVMKRKRKEIEHEHDV